MGAEEIAQRRPRGRGEREGERARGVAVEAVHHADVGPSRPQAGDVLLDAGQGGVLVVGVGRGRHREQPRRLVHHQDVVVFMEEREGRAHP
jgi:hypothetical protein